MPGTLTGVEAAQGITSTGGITPPPPPPPPPPTSNVAVAGDWVLCNSRVGWTSVNSQTRTSTTKAMLGTASTVQNQHLIGFGAVPDPQVGVKTASLTGNVVSLTCTAPMTGFANGQSIEVVGLGSPYDGTATITSVDTAAGTLTYAKTAANNTHAALAEGTACVRNFTYLDATFGYPTASTGFFSSAQERCLTACGCPIYMRKPKAGQPTDPMGPATAAELSTLALYPPPHSSWMPEFGALIAACMVRYPHVKYIQVWNEGKGMYFNTPASGSSVIPAGSGLPAIPAGEPTTNRWWMEGYTYMYNQIWSQVKAVRPDAFIVGPYPVYRGYSWDASTDWANDAFPDTMLGAWGYADKKVLRWIRYFARSCTGCDAICVDIRNLVNDWIVTDYYAPTSVPAAAAPANKWTTNPDGGNHPTYWAEGPVNGPWYLGKRQGQIIKYLRDLGAFSSAYQRATCDLRVIPLVFAEYYAYPERPMIPYADPHTGNYYATPNGLASRQEEAAAMAWQLCDAFNAGVYYCMLWQPQGSTSGDGEGSFPLALWKNGTLAATELKPVLDGIVANFPVGTMLKIVTSNLAEVQGMATATKLMVVNRSASPISLTADGQDITLSAYEVRFLTRV